ncbi:MAG: hypothetical protein JRJ29_21950, partial [Deltaproteobacteria bacterium]|nr:hypothetical protein [Deltaproteobacteria bacterium]
MRPARPRRRMLRYGGWAAVAIWMVLLGLLVWRTHQARLAPEAEGGRPAILNSSLEQDWMEIFLEGRKIGYSLSEVSRMGKAFLIREEMALRLNLLGRASLLEMESQCRVDGQWRLLDFTFRMTSGVVPFKVSGKVQGNRLHLVLGEGPSAQRQSLI